MKKIYIDVGANDGSSTMPIALSDPDAIVYAFEPNPEMIKLIEQRVQEHGIQDRYVHHMAAISDYFGVSDFNVCVTHDRGCSSLLEVSESGKTNWGGRTDMIPADSVKTTVMTMQQVIKIYEIKEIEYFHCDAQGSDLRVLKGFEDEIRIIKAGVVEAGTKPDVLYKGQNTLEETKAFLESNGFQITSIHSNDVNTNEVNVHFVRV